MVALLQGPRLSVQGAQRCLFLRRVFVVQLATQIAVGHLSRPPSRSGPELGTCPRDDPTTDQISDWTVALEQPPGRPIPVAAATNGPGGRRRGYLEAPLPLPGIPLGP